MTQISPHVGVRCRAMDDTIETVVRVVAGQEWLGRKTDRNGKVYSRKVTGGCGWEIDYVDQNGRTRRCSALSLQGWIRKWDARPLKDGK